MIATILLVVSDLLAISRCLCKEYSQEVWEYDCVFEGLRDPDQVQWVLVCLNLPSQRSGIV
jgi:hypothetical protein